VTLAPSTTGAPIFTSSPLPTSRTRSKVTASPVATSSFSILRYSPSATLYCLPPVTITAYIYVSPLILLTQRFEIMIGGWHGCMGPEVTPVQLRKAGKCPGGKFRVRDCTHAPAPAQ